MSVQSWQRESWRSQNNSARGTVPNARLGPVYSVGLNSRQASNPNPKVIPAPIPKNLVPYRKEESLKKLVENDDDDDVSNPQYQEFIARRDKQAQIPSYQTSSTDYSKPNDEPWYLKKPTVRIGDPIAICTTRGWRKAKVAAIKNGRIGVAETLTGWRYYRRSGPTTILYYDFDSPFWKYDGKRLVNDPKDVGRKESEQKRREEERNRYSYSYYNYKPPADPPAPEEQPVKFKVRRTEPIYYQNPETGRYIYDRTGPAYDKHAPSSVHHKEKIVLPPESHESHKRHSFFKNRSKPSESTNDASAPNIAAAKLERDRKRGEMIEQRIFCHLDKKQLSEYKQGKLKLNDLPALRPLLFDIDVDLDKQNIVYPTEADEEAYEDNEILVDGPVDEQHLAELNKAFFDQFGSESQDSDNGIVYADDGHSNEHDNELSRFDIRGSQCSYDMNIPSLSSSTSVELDPDALHIRPVNDDFALDAFHTQANYYDYNVFHAKKYDEELTLAAFNVVLGEPEVATASKLDQVQTIKPETNNYDVETFKKKYVEEDEFKPIVETHKVIKTMDLKLDYFVDVLDTRTGQIRCEMGPKLVEICDYEDVVKGPERLY